VKCLVCLKNESGTLYECPACQLVMVRKLREIEEYAAIIGATTAPTRGSNGRGSPGYRSTPPVNLDKLVALDIRSRAAGSDEWRDEELRWPDDGGSTRSILGTLAGLVEWIREERDEPRSFTDARTIVGECGYLRSITSWARGQQWVDTLAEDVGALHRQVRALAHDRPPGPLGSCLTVTCDGTVYRFNLHGDQSREDAGRCDGCGRTYSGVDLVRLAVAQNGASA
jgi:hypothetical protein